MNRAFTLVCVAFVLLLHISCQDSVAELDTTADVQLTRAANQRVWTLVQQARNGDADAFRSLALCYRDGSGVERSWLNMICMYATYCQKTGEDANAFIELFEEGDPFRLITEILNSSSLNKKNEERLALLYEQAPAEAKAVEAFKETYSVDDAAVVLAKIREAEEEGSEMAVIYQALYYEEIDDVEGEEEFYIRVSRKYPFFNLLLGDFYAERYTLSDDFSYILKAVDCFYKADAYGMLIPQYAYRLLRIYEIFEGKGIPALDEKEIERLNTISKRNL